MLKSGLTKSWTKQRLSSREPLGTSPNLPIGRGPLGQQFVGRAEAAGLVLAVLRSSPGDDGRFGNQGDSGGLAPQLLRSPPTRFPPSSNCPCLPILLSLGTLAKTLTRKRAGTKLTAFARPKTPRQVDRRYREV
jgi:hypothetical protein